MKHRIKKKIITLFLKIFLYYQERKIGHSKFTDHQRIKFKDVFQFVLWTVFIFCLIHKFTKVLEHRGIHCYQTNHELEDNYSQRNWLSAGSLKGIVN